MAKANVREQIVEAGSRLLLNHGFNATSVQDITTAAGVPKGSFYNHFESKEALGSEVVDRYGETSGSRAAIRNLALPGLERLRAHYDHLIAIYVGLNCERGCLLGNFSAELAGQSEPIRESLRQLYARWIAEIEVAIREGQAQGTISTALAPEVLAAFLTDSFEGAILRARVEKSQAPFDVFKKVVFSTLLP
jgi:TetR/AcrR family transcriptional regulator, transcriptional repressor for nem operon